jgi:exonuclease SbcC
MKIKKITLHPFAGIIDKTFEFEGGLNVVFGDNEAGKSTMLKALIMVLFESTNQTQNREQKLLENLLPAGGGDVVAVDLEFEYQLHTYILKKQWGKTKVCSLNKINEAPTTDPDEVQKRMDKILKQNKLVWENVMFTSQSKLSLTHSDIFDNTHISTTLDSILQNSIINNAGIAPEALQALIEKQLEELIDNWDLENNKPVIGSKSKGSYDNPHKNNIGKILKMDYEIYELNQKCTARKNHDVEYDKVITDIQVLTENYHQEVKSFLDIHRDHIDDLRKRTSLIKDKEIIQANYREIEADSSKWNTAASQIELLELNYKNAQNSKNEIEAEKEIADKKKSGKSVLEKFNSVKDLLKEIITLQEDQKKYIFITPEDLKTINESINNLKEQSAIFDSYKKLQSFNVEVVSINNITIDITNGNDPTTKVDLFTATPHVFKADGGFELKSHDLKINVIADAENRKTCEQEIEKINAMQNEILIKYASDSMDSLIDSNKTWLRIEAEINNKKTFVSRLLGNQTIEKLNEEANELNNLKSTRNDEVLNEAYKNAVQLESDSKNKFDNAQTLIQHYSLKYDNIAALKKKDFDLLKKISDLEDIINSLSPLPDEQISLDDLIKNFDAKLMEEIAFKDEIQKLQFSKRELELLSDENTSADYEDQINILKNEKNQKIAEAKAIIKIKAKLDEITNRTPANPYNGYHNNMRHYLSILSGGKYADFNIDKSLPESIKQQNNTALKLSLLSQGTSGLLGMALRLSMADYFLENREGFLIMDDPMTDMDSGRQTNTVSCLNDYAQSRQVIVFTCHQSHADQFDGNRINLN